MLGIFKDEIKVEVLRKTVMGMGHWGYGGIKGRGPNSLVSQTDVPDKWGVLKPGL